MPQYVVNNKAQHNGDHEVHRSGCNYFPVNYKDLGNHQTCQTAVLKAKAIYRTANGCKFCSPDCHTQ